MREQHGILTGHLSASRSEGTRLLGTVPLAQQTPSPAPALANLHAAVVARAGTMAVFRETTGIRQDSPDFQQGVGSSPCGEAGRGPWLGQGRRCGLEK